MKKSISAQKEYMTAGEAAEKMGITVRTLQYYDRAGLLAPSARSGGGRRLYTYKDLLVLHQIISLKSLGFSLRDIKEKLMPLDSPADVELALAQQADNIRDKIKNLSDTLKAIEKLRVQAAEMQTVDFKKYADIIINLQMGNNYYYLIKRFDSETLDYIRRRFDRQSGTDFIERFSRLIDEILDLKNKNLPPQSAECRQLAGVYMDLITEFTNGDMSMLDKLTEIGSFENASNRFEEKCKAANEYLAPAIQICFSEQGIGPFKEEQNASGSHC